MAIPVGQPSLWRCRIVQVSRTQAWVAPRSIQLWFLELHDSPLELKGELQYLDENCHFRGEKMTILVYVLCNSRLKIIRELDFLIQYLRELRFSV